MTHHDGTDHDHTDGEHAAVPVSTDAEETGAPETELSASEAANFVYPVDHGAGTAEEPLESEAAGDYVSDDRHGKAAGSYTEIDDDSTVDSTDEKGDYAGSVNQTDGTEEEIDGAGDYVSGGSR